ncbi:three-helix bundle dimerization domain-containing protein [Streptomyces aureus]|uniref:three-helix bundle dimerization domain-containing protein n=1 Tax=Streptomyces aureus TaxID=193461 RepID=UPI0036CD76F6
MKTDEPEAAADESQASRGASRAPAPPTKSAPPANSAPPGDPALPGNTRHDEAVALGRLTARLKAAYPSVDPAVVDQVVDTARGSFRQAKVRTYVPILVERRVRALLAGLDGEADGTPGGTAPGDTGSARPRTAGSAERSAERPRRTPLLGRWIPARLRPAPASASDLGGAGDGP